MQTKDVLVSRLQLWRQRDFACRRSTIGSGAVCRKLDSGAFVGAIVLQRRRAEHRCSPGQRRPDSAPAATDRPPTDSADPGPEDPDGFTPIFNGKDLTGWHVSKTNHHGTTPDYRVLHGLIVGTQNPRGKGGILLTDKKYKNVEVYMEIKPDWGCDSGLFLRSSEAGEAYQVTLDYLPGGGMGGIYGERLTGVQDASTATAKLTDESAPRRRSSRPTWQKAWKREAWNSVRARIDGDVAAHHRLDQRSARHRLHRHRESRRERRDRRHDRHSDALQRREDAALGRWRLLALARRSRSRSSRP